MEMEYRKITILMFNMKLFKTKQVKFPLAFALEVKLFPSA